MAAEAPLSAPGAIPGTPVGTGPRPREALAGGNGAPLTGELTGERGEKLVYERWPGAGPVVGSPVVFLHGFGDHRGPWRHVAEAVSTRAERDFWAIDLRGHGQSGGKRADVGRLDWVLADVDRLLALVCPGPSKAVLFGDSMGGAIAAAYAVSRPGRLAGLVLSAPALHLVTYPAWQAVAVRALANVWPGAPLVRLNPVYSTHDEALVEASRTDPLGWHGRAKARSAVTMHEAGRRSFAAAASIEVPVLVLHGEDDRVVPAGSSKRFFDVVGSADKERVTFPGFYHEVFKELGRDRPVEILVGWLKRH